MTRWLVEIDELALEAAAGTLGTTTVEETIDLALRQLAVGTCTD